MKRFILSTCLLLLILPLAGRAQNGQGGNDNCQGQEPSCTHKRIGAREMGAIGAGVAVFLGVAGYLVLRRRKAA